MVATVKTSVPAQKDVLVPETLLKSRKASAASREERLAKAAETKKVSISHPFSLVRYSQDENLHSQSMTKGGILTWTSKRKQG